MKQDAAKELVEWALMVLLMILVSWPLAIFIWVKWGVGAGVILMFSAFILSLVGWPFSGVLLLMTFMKRPIQSWPMRLWFVSVFLWLMIGYGLIYVATRR